MFIPGPNFFHPGYRIRIKTFKYCDPKNVYQALGNMIRVVHPGSESRFFTHPGSSGQKGNGSLIRIRNTDAKWCSFQLCCCFFPYIMTFISTFFMNLLPLFLWLQQLFSSSIIIIQSALVFVLLFSIIVSAPLLYTNAFHLQPHL